MSDLDERLLADIAGLDPVYVDDCPITQPRDERQSGLCSICAGRRREWLGRFAEDARAFIGDTLDSKPVPKRRQALRRGSHELPAN
jgi:hypothetical protein